MLAHYDPALPSAHEFLQSLADHLLLYLFGMLARFLALVHHRAYVVSRA